MWSFSLVENFIWNNIVFNLWRPIIIWNTGWGLQLHSHTNIDRFSVVFFHLMATYVPAQVFVFKNIVLIFSPCKQCVHITELVCLAQCFTMMVLAGIYVVQGPKSTIILEVMSVARYYHNQWTNSKENLKHFREFQHYLYYIKCSDCVFKKCRRHFFNVITEEKNAY